MKRLVRMLHCKECKKKFTTMKPKQLYCSLPCYHAHRMQPAPSSFSRMITHAIWLIGVLAYVSLGIVAGLGLIAVMYFWIGVIGVYSGSLK